MSETDEDDLHPALCEDVGVEKPIGEVFIQPTCSWEFCPQRPGGDGPCWCGDNIGCNECGRGGARYSLTPAEGDGV